MEVSNYLLTGMILLTNRVTVSGEEGDKRSNLSKAWKVKRSITASHLEWRGWKQPPSSTGEGGGVLNMVVIYNHCLVKLGYN